MSIDHLLNQTFTSQRPARVSDGMGSFIASLAANGSFKGRIQPLSANDRQLGQRNEILTSHRLYVKVGTVIARDDELAVGTLSFKVVAVLTPSRIDHHLEVDCLEIVRGT